MSINFTEDYTMVELSKDYIGSTKFDFFQKWKAFNFSGYDFEEHLVDEFLEILNLN